MTAVLIVDDDRLISQTLQAILSDAGYSVRVAENGQDALAALRVSRPDLILLDLQMPVMDGWEFIESYQALVHNQTIPIVTLSVNPGMTRSYDRLGVRAHVLKPFDVDALLKVLRSVLSESSPPA